MTDQTLLPRSHALIVAAGRGSRFGGPLPKQYCLLAGRPVLRHTALAFLHHPAIASVRIAIHPDDRALYDQAVGDLGLPEPVAGGALRQDSVRNLIESLDVPAGDYVLIHDGARPLVSPAIIDGTIAALADADGAIAALPLRDTVKRAVGTGITETVDRTYLWRAQTPQGFRYGVIAEAHRFATGLDLSDDAAVAEQAGYAVELVMGD